MDANEKEFTTDSSKPQMGEEGEPEKGTQPNLCRKLRRQLSRHFRLLSRGGSRWRIEGASLHVRVSLSRVPLSGIVSFVAEFGRSLDEA